MTFASNLYAEKIYAEHPICMWALDDNADFARMMSDANLQLNTVSLTKTPSTGWTINEITSFSSYQTPPIGSAKTFEITLPPNNFTSGVATASFYQATGTSISSVSDSFTIGFYYYTDSPYINSVTVGYAVGNTLQDSETFSVPAQAGWNFVTKTFDNHSASQIVQLYFGFAYSENPDLPAPNDDYIILINGLSIGYRSEDFNKESIGISLSEWSLGANTVSNIMNGFNSLTYGYTADAYGINGTDKNGYYIVRYSKLSAKNAQVPMVFGSSNSTIIYPNPSAWNPSMVFPGQGFLNKTGKDKQYCFEFWLRARVLKNNGIKKIFGPVNSADGIYVNKTSMVLKIGNKTGSYYVGEWYRPLLININYSPSTVTLMVNGEVVIVLSIDSTDTALFPDKEGILTSQTGTIGTVSGTGPYTATITNMTNTSFAIGQVITATAGTGSFGAGTMTVTLASATSIAVSSTQTFTAGTVTNIKNSVTKENDWLAFYADESLGVASLEIDGVAIYPYQVEREQAKRRYVFGQGVEFPQNINTAYHGKTFLIDYDAANYANNYKQPGIKRWNTKAIDNFSIQDGTLSTPKMSLPSFNYLNNQTYSDLCSQQTTTSYYRINTTTGLTGYFLYDSLDVLENGRVKAFVISAFPTGYTVGVDQTIFKLINKNTGDYVTAKLVPSTTTSATMTYKYKIGDSAEQTLDAALNYTVASNSNTTVGFDMPIMLEKQYETLGDIFSNNANTQLYIGNDESFSTPLIGRFYTIGFCSADNFAKTISSYFTNGIMTNTGTGRTAAQTQTLVSGFLYSYSLLLKQPLGLTSYSFDIGASSNWQDYVPVATLAKYTTNASTSAKTYDLDFIQFNVDYPEPCLFSGGNYNTDNSDIKTYIYFRYLSNGAYVDASTLTAVSLPESGVVVPGSSWSDKKYEVVNGSIVYLPSNLNINTTINDLAIGIVVDSQNQTTLLSGTKIRSLELAAQAVDTETEKWKNGFSTKFAEKVYPYSHRTADASNVFNYKDKNPYRIYKGNSPYLYLTRDSGIRVLSTYSNGVSDSRGILVPINDREQSDFNISSIQMFVRNEAASFPTSETKIFSINYLVYDSSNLPVDTTLDFYMIATGNTTSARRAKIYAKIGSTEYKNINYYINGVSTSNPVLTIGEWSNIGIEFPALIDIDSMIGSINIVGPLTINNISYYQYTGPQQSATKYAQQKWQHYKHLNWYLLNLIPISSFENVSTNWIYSPSGGGTGTITPITTVTPKYGSYVLKATSTSGTGRLGVLHNGGIISVTPGTQYTYSMYVKDGTSSELFANYIEWRNGSTVLSTTSGTNTAVTTSDWTKVSVTGTAPATATNVRVYTYSATAPNSIGVYAYFDGAVFQPVGSATDYYGSWYDVLSTTYSSILSINPGDMYDVLIGTNKSIVDNSTGTNAEKTLKVKMKSKKIITSTDWQDFTKKPV